MLLKDCDTVASVTVRPGQCPESVLKFQTFTTVFGLHLALMIHETPNFNLSLLEKFESTFVTFEPLSVSSGKLAARAREGGIPRPAAPRLRGQIRR